MYLKNFKILNVGPIDNIEINFSFNEDKSPQPLILVGENGSGKSIALSFIINSIIQLKQNIFNNFEIKQGIAYKKRSPLYIRNERDYYFAKLEFDKNIVCKEWQLTKEKQAFNYCPINADWNELKDEESSVADIQGLFSVVKDFVTLNTLLYFPPNRFEEPGWLNLDNLNSDSQFEKNERIIGNTLGKTIVTDNIKNLKNWIYDVIFDHTLQEVSDGERTTKFYKDINKIIKLIFGIEDDKIISYKMGDRKSRRISINLPELKEIPDLYTLSTGESVLIGLFFSIIRDYDLTGQTFNSISEIKGIVIIDEIEMHLHSGLQHQVLPKLIKFFPQVQFIITTHSPLFVLGMEKEFGENYEIREMPGGNIISSDRFREFEGAYNFFNELKKFDNTIKDVISTKKSKYVFCEGETDPIYIKHAAKVLGYEKLIDDIEIRCIGYTNKNGTSQFNGKSNLNHTYSFLKGHNDLVEGKILLLYDCETNKNKEDSDDIFIRTIPHNSDNNIVKIGIENLLPKHYFEDKTKFYDTEMKITEEGAENHISKLNKMRLCKYICKSQPTIPKEDLKKFHNIFTIFEEVFSS